MAIAPRAVAVRSVVAPAVPIVSIVAVSRSGPESMRIESPAAKPSAPATLMLVAPATEATGRVVAAWVRKSAQLLAVSAPSGKRPVLAVVAAAAA